MSIKSQSTTIIDNSVISAGMGHTSEQTTQIYLTMLEKSLIDDANKGLIRSLLE